MHNLLHHVPDAAILLAVLYFLYSVIVTAVDNLFFLDFGICNIINQSPAYSTATSGINKSILRTSVEGIFAIHKFRMKHNISGSLTSNQADVPMFSSLWYELLPR